MRRILSRMVGVFAFLALLAAWGPALAEDGAVNLNTATEEELMSLPGIGPSKAKAIADYREAHPFETVEEVKNVRGIGDHTFETLKDKITVGAAAPKARDASVVSGSSVKGGK